jgi:hypothetical protein
VYADQDVLPQQAIGQNIDAAEEETCDRCDAIDRACGFQPPLKRAHVGLGHRLVPGR